MNVEELLRERNIYYKPQGRDLVVHCLNPEHEDSNPSMRIDRHLGFFNCFSCGFKGNIFKLFGIKRDIQEARIQQLKNKIKNLMSSADLPNIEGHKFTRDYRGISAQTYEHFSAFYILDGEEPEDLYDRVCFPVKDFNKQTVAVVGRSLRPSVKPKYKVYPRHVNIPIYPINPKYGKLYLVEGIFDVLSLYEHGISNVACNWGVSTPKDITKYELLKLAGVNNLVIAFDGDEAGRLGAKKLKNRLDTLFNVEILNLPDDKDPGSLTEKEIKEYFYEYSGS